MGIPPVDMAGGIYFLYFGIKMCNLVLTIAAQSSII
nr:MAG TPA: hypothetical protein [Caudoviricetes sp.]